MAATVLSGLDAAHGLPVGSGYVLGQAGASHAWGGDTTAFLRAEAGWHPLGNLDAFAFGEADTVGARAGIGARLTF